MIRTIAAWSTVLLAAAFGSIGVAYALSRLEEFDIGDMGGVIYLYLATPTVAAFAAVLLMKALPASLGLARRSAAVLALILSASVLVHYWGLSHQAIGGSYRYPPAFNAAAQGIDELKGLARARNYEVAGAALAELGRRGSAGADALMELIEEEQRRAGASFVDSTLTFEVAQLLAKQRDRRIIPILEGMLRSEATVVDTTFDASGRASRVAVFPTRQTAVRLLSDEFGVRAQVETRRPIP